MNAYPAAAARAAALLFSSLLTLPAQEVALSIQYSADGLQLTPAMVQGLINGPVRERLRAERDGNPDWPEMATVTVSQSDADHRQPAGAFSCVLNLKPGAARQVGPALQAELEQRLHGAPRQALLERLKESEVRLQSIEANLQEANDQLGARFPDVGSDDVGDLARRLEEARLRLRVEQPLQKLGEQQASELRQRADVLRVQLQKLSEEASRVERELSRKGEESLIGQLSRLQTEREALQHEHERVADQLAQTTDSMTSRTAELLSAKQQIDALAERLALAQKQREEAMAKQRQVSAMEQRIEALTTERDALRNRFQELKARLDAMVDVRVDVWG